MIQLNSSISAEGMTFQLVNFDAHHFIFIKKIILGIGLFASILDEDPSIINRCSEIHKTLIQEIRSHLTI